MSDTVHQNQDVAPAEVSNLLAAFDGEDPDQFAELYRHYKPSLTRFARSTRAVDPEGVADLALFDGYRALDTMRRRDYQAFTGYLYQAVRSHVAREHRRTVSSTPTVIDDQVLKPAAGFESDLVNSLAVRELIEQLPTDQKAVVNHRFIDGLTAQETGLLLDKEPNAVYQLQHRATRRLQRMILAAVIVALVAAAGVVIFRQAETQEVDSSPAEPDRQEVNLPSPAPNSELERERENTTTTALAQSESELDSGGIQLQTVDAEPQPLQTTDLPADGAGGSAEPATPTTTSPPTIELPQEEAATDEPEAEPETETAPVASSGLPDIPAAAIDDVVNATVGELVDVNVRANDQSPTLDTDTVVLFSGGVDGLTLSADGRLTGRPVKAGISVIIYRLMGTNGSTDLGQIQITVE